MATYLLSNDAVADLQAIWFYGASQWDIAQADKYAIKIDKMCEFLLDNPGVGKNRDEIMTGLKSHSIGSHSIYYVEQDQTILVVRILHQPLFIQSRPIVEKRVPAVLGLSEGRRVRR